ncbi:MAG TPA: Calx-beta domain-containing protein [Pyrinomonadaceae bacterium]|jgi:hypothetical protein
MKRLIVLAFAMLGYLTLSASAFAQTTILDETVGNPAGTTAIGSYAGWSSTGFTFTGTGDVRSTSSSGGYAGASGMGNVFLTNSGGANFQIAGVNTTGYSSLTLSFGVFKTTTTANGSDLVVQVSDDGANYTNLTVPALPTGAGTSAWVLRTAAGAIPSTSNLRIRFANTGTTTQYRIDDIKLTGSNLSTTVEFISQSFAEDESQSAVVTVERFGDLSSPMTVNYATQTAGSTATRGAACGAAGVDYINRSGTLTFAAEEEFKEFQVPICGDIISEAGEFFIVSLSNPTNGSLGSIQTAQVFINDTANQFLNPNPVFIETGGEAYGSSIQVSGAPTSIGSMRVTLYDFEHINADDLDVLLVGPQGQKLLLMGDAGGADGLAETATVTFDDQAGRVLPDNLPIMTGRYEPTTWEAGQTSLPAPAPPAPYSEPGSAVGGAASLGSVFGGANANGTWTLYIRDDDNAFRPLGADGVVRGGWGLQFIPTTAAGVSVSGQVRGAGLPVGGAAVTIYGGDLVTPLTVKTNSFGRYTFNGLKAGEIYVVSVAAKRYNFSPSSIVLNVGDNILDADFEAEDK